MGQDLAKRKNNTEAAEASAATDGYEAQLLKRRIDVESRKRTAFGLSGICVLVILATSSVLTPGATAFTASGGSNHAFEISKVKYYPKAVRGILLNNATVVFYFEETRPATKEEKAKRAQVFDKEWKELEEKAKKSIPAMEKSVETGAKEAQEEAAKNPLLKPLHPSFAIVPKFFSGVIKMGMEIAKAEGKRYFVNQPVVTKAGFIFDYQGEKQEEVLLPLEEFYGPEEWQRIPNDAVNIQASSSGAFLGLETEKGGIILFDYEPKERRYVPLGRIEGRHPYGFSDDDKYMFVTLDKGSYRIDILPPPGWREMRYFVSPHRVFKEVKINVEKGDPVKDVILVGDYLFVLTWTKLFVYDIINDRIHREYNFGGTSLILGPSGDVFVIKMDKSSVVRVNTRDWNVRDFIRENWFDLTRKHRVYFLKLVSISRDERYVAALYDPGLIPPQGAKNWSGETIGESRLFIWDVKERRVAYGLNERLEDITGGFGYQSPAYFTRDWGYLLLRLKDNGLELLRIKR